MTSRTSPRRQVVPATPRTVVAGSDKIGGLGRREAPSVRLTDRRLREQVAGVYLQRLRKGIEVDDP